MKHIPKDTSPRDDAYHGPYHIPTTEWWYFDAIFENNYSLHIGIRTFSRWGFGFAMSCMEIYKEGKLISKSSRILPFSSLHISKDFPSITLLDKPIMVFDVQEYKSSGKWKYHIEMEFDSCKARLDFTGETRGWKIETPAESWCVALPRARVEGNLQFDDKSMDVKGIGYHDHNWNYSLLTVMRYGKGWFWGRINSENFTIVWASIIKDGRDNIAIVNKKEGDYLCAKEVKFEIKKFKDNLPSAFHLRFKGKGVEGDISLFSKEMHREKVVLLLPYCRYHAESEGFIRVDSIEERTRGLHIMEFLSFG